jgi:hypothetical protein
MPSLLSPFIKWSCPKRSLWLIWKVSIVNSIEAWCGSCKSLTLRITLMDWLSLFCVGIMISLMYWTWLSQQMTIDLANSSP